MGHRNGLHRRQIESASKTLEKRPMLIGTGRQPLFGLSDFTLGFQGRRHVEVLG